MGSQKPRIATYTDEETVRKFKIISAFNDMSMSEYLEKIIKREIELYNIPDQIEKVSKTYFLKKAAI